MLDSDAPTILQCLKDHFHKATDADGPLVWSQVKGYSLEDARGAIEQHRMEQGKMVARPDIARIRVLAATRYRDRNPYQQNKTIWQAVCRGVHGFSGGGSAAARTADLMRHFGDAWGNVKTAGTDERGKQGVRSLILHSARLAFRQEGMSEDQADTAARELVELRPGEKIMLAPIFRDAPKRANSSAAKARAIKALGGGLPPVDPPEPNPLPIDPNRVFAPVANVAADFDEEPA